MSYLPTKHTLRLPNFPAAPKAHDHHSVSLSLERHVMKVDLLIYNDRFTQQKKANMLLMLNEVLNCTLGVHLGHQLILPSMPLDTVSTVRPPRQAGW
jgi:hypothetical protein